MVKRSQTTMTANRTHETRSSSGTTRRLCVAFILSVALVHFGGGKARALVINEFMAWNHSTIADGDGDYEDWIEIHNPSGSAVNLGGYSLTDDPAVPDKWVFPAVWIPGGGYVFVWASGKDRRQAGMPLHANFRLENGGEYIGLFDPGGAEVDSITFGQQYEDASYGRKPDGSATWLFFIDPTPMAPNTSQGAPGFAADPVFTPDPGVYSGSVVVSISSPTTGGAEVRYELGGREPTQSSPLYTSPLTFTTPTVVRARAYAPSLFPSRIVTGTYLVNVETSMPIISIVTDPDNLWGPSGIYYANLSGEAGERPCHVEYWEKGGAPGFTINCGLRIHGGASKSRDDIHKKSFRLHFRRVRGPTKLEYPLFDSTPVDRFNQLVLRANYNDSWTHWSTTQRANAIYIRDELTRVLRLEMGDLACHGLHCMLFLNGHRWGVYNICERVENDFMESYLGHDDWDIVTLNNEIAEGDRTAWDSFYNWVTTHDLSNEANYQALEAMLDIDNFTNYMIENIWQRNNDWPHHNGYVARPRGVAGARWIAIDWDAEYGFGGGPWAGDPTRNMLARASNPSNGRIADIFNRMLQNADYRVFFAQRMDVWLNTVLREGHVLQRMDEQAAMIRPGMPYEAQWAKTWGEIKTINDWEAALQRARNFVNQRTYYVRLHVMERFSEVTGWSNVTVLPPEGGEGDVLLHSIRPTTYPWTGTFFEGIPLVLRAVPRPGYVFDSWSDDSLPNTPTVAVMLGGGGSAEDTLIARGSVWKYNDTGTDLGTAWRAPTYDDSTWQEGPAELGYGDGDEQTVISYGPDPSNKYPCYYFRRSFTVDDPSQFDDLLIRIKRDDGAVVYLNGTEVVRDNMPAGTIAYDTFALGAASENTWYEHTIDPSLLVAGANVLAVEVHQNQPASSDISFDLELVSPHQSQGYTIYARFAPDMSAPSLASVEFVARNRVVATFSKPVKQASAETRSNYSLDHAVGGPVSATMLTSTSVLLQFADNLAPDTTYTLSVVNVEPVVGSPIPSGSPATATASFTIPPVTISEIMYNSIGADVEWIELHNTTDAPVDVSGWYLTDDANYPAQGEGNWSLPAATIIPPHGYLVVGLDREMGGWNFPPTVAFVQAIINDGGNLDNAGDNLALFDGPTGGNLVDGSLGEFYPDLAAAGQSIEKVDDDFPWCSHPQAWRACPIPIEWQTSLGEYATPGKGAGEATPSAVEKWKFY